MSSQESDPNILEHPENVPSAASEVVAHRADQLLRQWHTAHWGIRVTVVTGALILVLVLLEKFWSPEAVSLLLFFGLPLMAGLVIALARPQPVIAWMDHALVACARRRDKATAKDTVPSRWFFRPLYSGLCLVATWTRGIRDPYLRCGVALALQIYLIYTSLVVAYIAIGVVIAIAMFIVMLWIMAKFLSGDWSSSSRTNLRERRVQRAPVGTGRSEVREGFWGNKYVQHFDENGRKIAQTHEKEGFWGNHYQETVSEDGGTIGRSEEREGFWGDKYTQHYDADGRKSGKSELREGFLGNPYAQHYDQDGNKVGRSEEREDFFGQKYVEHKEDS